MDISIDRNGKMPLYLQIKEQIRYLIISGRLEPGQRLPHREQLARFLQVNPRTIHSGIDELVREGYLTSRKGVGTFVSADPHPQGESKIDEFNKALDRLMLAAYSLGHSAEDVARIIAERYQAPCPQIEGHYVVFVECNLKAVATYKREIEARLRVPVTPVLLQQIEGRAEGIMHLLRDALVVITTFSHLHHLKLLLAEAGMQGIETVGVTAGPYIDILLQLSKLPKGTCVGLFTGSEANALARAVADAGINHIKVLCANVLDTQQNKDRLKQADILVVSSSVLDEAIAEGYDVKNAIIYSKRLDAGSIEMLRHLIPVLTKQRVLKEAMQ